MQHGTEGAIRGLGYAALNSITLREGWLLARNREQGTVVIHLAQLDAPADFVAPGQLRL
jgi:hypothetical protein